MTDTMAVTWAVAILALFALWVAVDGRRAR